MSRVWNSIGKTCSLLSKRIQQLEAPWLPAGQRALKSFQAGSSSPLKGASAFIRSASFVGVTRGFATTGVAMAGLRGSLFPGSSSVSQMGLLGWLLADLAINWAGWGVAAYLKTELFYDLLGTSSFAVLAFGSLAVGGAGSARQILISCMVGAWVVRLGYFLVSRVLAHGSDSRFDGVRDQPATFFVYWTMQAVWVWVTLLPVLLINNMAAPLALAWRASDIIGVAMFSVGLGMEATADAQKTLFQKDPANHGRYIEVGLWALSRHPNYLGEMMVWSGIFVTAAAAFTATPWMFVSIVSPVFVITLLSKLSGIPILEDRADKKWGHLEAYQHYKDTTPVLLPFWPSAWTLSKKKGAPLLTSDTTPALPEEHSAVPKLSSEPVVDHGKVSPQ